MQFDRLKRREVITLFGGVSVTACGAALVQVLKQAGSDLAREYHAPGDEPSSPPASNAVSGN